MTSLAWWDDLLTDERIFEVSGFAQVRMNWRDVETAMGERLPILMPMPTMARVRYVDVWFRENIRPLVWLSMPDHEPARIAPHRPSTTYHRKGPRDE